MGTLLALLDRVPRSWIRAAGNMRGRSAGLKAVTDWLPDLLRNRDGTIQRGLGRGLRFNGGSSAVGFVLGTHDLEVQNALARFLSPGMTAFDIGANVGFTALLAARQVAPDGRVVCFEPLPDNIQRIVHNASLNAFSFVEVKPIALSRDNGEAEFFLSEAPTWGRLAQAGPAPKQSGIVRVPVRSLDSLYINDALPKPHFIKMDVEGAEADVLTGGRALLAAARPVMVIELHHTYDAVVAALEGLDYVVRPLTATGTVASTADEFQLLAYPRERSDAESTWKELTSGKMAYE
jgi:FkbM family methyltransferase